MLALAIDHYKFGLTLTNSGGDVFNAPAKNGFELRALRLRK
jgi:hypothetical protein